MRICSICGDVVLYCTCMLEENRVVESPIYSENPSFSIYKGSSEVEWDSASRTLSGDPVLIQEIMKHLHGGYQDLLEPGFGVWMRVEDPNGVFYVAKELIEGCSFSDTAPDWSEITDPDTIY